MSESPEHTTDTTPVVAATDPIAERTVTVAEAKPNRLYQAAAWVAIVAGTLFVISVIFFSGFVLGRHAGGPGHCGRHDGHGMVTERRGPMMHPGGPGMMRPGGPGQGDPGQGGPGPAGPGQVAPGQAGPGQPPPSR